MKKTKDTKGRGWIVDQLLTIGHLEATLSHLDELIGDSDKYDELCSLVYESRRSVMANLLKEADDENLWCVVKHLSTAYVVASEVCHARGFDKDSRMLMGLIGDSMAAATELALGVESTACLRCLSDKNGGKD